MSMFVISVSLVLIVTPVHILTITITITGAIATPFRLHSTAIVDTSVPVACVVDWTDWLMSAA